MIVVFSQTLKEILPWETIGGNVVRSLDIEGLFDFGVRRDEEMEDDEGRNEETEKNIWVAILAKGHKSDIAVHELPIAFILNPPTTVSLF
jgi:hypothetical protein